jgi:hypothetical protein
MISGDILERGRETRREVLTSSLDFAARNELLTTVRMLFPPATDQLQGANVSADWLKQSGGSLGNAETSTRAVKGVAAIVVAVIAGMWMADRAALPKARIVTLLLVLLIAYQVWKRG